MIDDEGAILSVGRLPEAGTGLETEGGPEGGLATGIGIVDTFDELTKARSLRSLV